MSRGAGKQPIYTSKQPIKTSKYLIDTSKTHLFKRILPCPSPLCSLTADDVDNISIGPACPGCFVALLDGDSIVPVGSAGEICVGGAQVRVNRLFRDVDWLCGRGPGEETRRGEAPCVCVVV